MLDLQMTKYNNFNSNSAINVRSINQYILFVLLICLLPLNILPSQLFPNKNISDSIHYYGVIILIFLLILIFRPLPVKEFVQDSRFKTPPGWINTLFLIGIIFSVILGFLIFVLSLLDFFSPIMGEIYSSSPADLPQSTIPYNQITETFDFVSGSVNFLVVVIIVPFYEELLYRGLALRAYERARSPLFAATFTTVLFALFHLNWFQLILTIPFSFIVARAVQVIGSWWIAVIVHAVYNGFYFFTSFSISVNGTATDHSISLLTGTIGLIIAIIALGIVMYWLKIHDNKVSIHDNKVSVVPKKRESIFTFSLYVFVFICVIILL